MPAIIDRVNTETERFWEARYAGREQTWSGKVNPWLTELVADLDPGRALDLGCGEGADAVWLAAAGWDVVATDVSPTALARTASAAAEAGVGERVTTHHHDLEADRPDGPFDLVSAQFLQSPLAFARDEILRAMAATLVPGGRLLVVDHGAPPSGHGHAHAVFRSPEETWHDIGLDGPGWDVERLESRPRGEHVDVVVLARRAT